MKGYTKLGVSGSYSLRVFDCYGQEVKEKYIPFVQNTVTNEGLSSFVFNTNNYFFQQTEIAVGTGTNTISKTSTGLGNQIAVTSTTTNIENENLLNHTDNGDGTVTTKAVFSLSFDIGTFGGDTISEVGLNNGESFQSGFFAGQLIKDQNGNPTTITILSTEELIVEYVIEVTSWFTAQSVASGTVTVNGVTSNYTLNVNPWLRNSDLSAGSSSTSITRSSGQLVFFDSTKNSLFSVDFSNNVWTISSGVATYSINYTAAPSSFASNDLKYVVIGSSFSSNDPTNIFDYPFVLEFGTPIEKTSSQAMTIDLSIDITATQV